AGGRRLDRQFQLGELSHHDGQPRGLPGRQGGGDRPDARAGARSRTAQDPPQRHHAGLDHDPAPDRSVAHAAGRGRADAGAGPEGEALSARHRPHGAVARGRRQPPGVGAELRGRRGSHVTAIDSSLTRKAYRIGSTTARHLLPPTLYFFFAFNLISFTTDVLVHNYWFHLTSVVVASTTALVVAKVMLVAEKLPFIDRF